MEIVLVATPFNPLIQKELSLNLLHNPVVLGGVLGITIGVGVLSGLYPALYLPSMPTINSLKGTFKSSVVGLRLRKTLVTLQFVISISVVICTFLMWNQLEFMRNTELGFNQEHLLLIPIQDTLVERQIPVIRHELQANPRILDITVSYQIPGVNVNSMVFVAETDSAMVNLGFRVLYVGKNYLKTMGMKLLAGRDFHDDVANDVRGQSFIVNETAAKKLGWYQPAQKNASPEDALDKKLMSYGAEAPGHVVGVVQDFNTHSLHNAVEPTVLVPMDEARAWYFCFRLQGDRPTADHSGYSGTVGHLRS